MLFPAPVRPTSVTCSPSFTVMEKSESTGFSPYPKVTWDSTTLPRGGVFCFGGMVRSGWERKASIRFMPAMADWMVWISMPRLSMGVKMREM